MLKRLRHRCYDLISRVSSRVAIMPFGNILDYWLDHYHYYWVGVPPWTNFCSFQQVKSSLQPESLAAGAAQGEVCGDGFAGARPFWCYLGA